MTTNKDSQLFGFMRYSPGLVAKFHLPVFKHGKSVFAGVGFIYHWMSFESFSASAPGLRVLLGFELYTGTSMIELFGAFDYAKAGTGEPIGYGHAEEMVLNYTGGLVGFNIHFGLL